MNQIKAMPEQEKFEHTFEMVDLYQKNVLPFVEAHLGPAERHNLHAIWQAAIAPIRQDDGDYKRYASAHSNWLWIAHCSHNTLAEMLSSDEVLEYKRMLLRMYKQQRDNPNLAILRLLKAHVTLARLLLYEMQWMTPITVAKCSRSEVVCVVPECKVLKTSGTDRICRVDCQNVGRAFSSQMYNLRRVTVLKNHGCTITLTPIVNHKQG